MSTRAARERLEAQMAKARKKRARRHWAHIQCLIPLLAEEGRELLRIDQQFEDEGERTHLHWNRFQRVPQAIVDEAIKATRKLLDAREEHRKQTVYYTKLWSKSAVARRSILAARAERRRERSLTLIPHEGKKILDRSFDADTSQHLARYVEDFGLAERKRVEIPLKPTRDTAPEKSLYPMSPAERAVERYRVKAIPQPTELDSRRNTLSREGRVLEDSVRNPLRPWEKKPLPAGPLRTPISATRKSDANNNKKKNKSQKKAQAESLSIADPVLKITVAVPKMHLQPPPEAVKEYNDALLHRVAPPKKSERRRRARSIRGEKAGGRSRGDTVVGGDAGAPPLPPWLQQNEDGSSPPPIPEPLSPIHPSTPDNNKMMTSEGSAADDGPHFMERWSDSVKFIDQQYERYNLKDSVVSSDLGSMTYITANPHEDISNDPLASRVSLLTSETIASPSGGAGVLGYPARVSSPLAPTTVRASGGSGRHTNSALLARSISQNMKSQYSLSSGMRARAVSFSPFGAGAAGLSRDSARSNASMDSMDSSWSDTLDSGGRPRSATDGGSRRQRRRAGTLSSLGRSSSQLHFDDQHQVDPFGQHPSLSRHSQRVLKEHQEFMNGVKAKVEANKWVRELQDIYKREILMKRYKERLNMEILRKVSRIQDIELLRNARFAKMSTDHMPIATQHGRDRTDSNRTRTSSVA